MKGKQDWIAERIDRSKEAPAAKKQRSRRALYLKMQARRTVTDVLRDIDCPSERDAILGDLIEIAAEHRWPIIGRVETATRLDKVAADICAALRLPRAIKNAAAEHAFARLTAANDTTDTETSTIR